MLRTARLRAARLKTAMLAFAASRRRLLLVVVAALLAGMLLMPFWYTRMEAPQYQGDEALEVWISPGSVKGDMREIETLNGYVGVHLSMDKPELKASPWVIAALLAVALGCVAVPAPWRRKSAAGLLVLLILTAVGGGALLYYRLYQLGHDREASAFVGFEDFTPPLLGTRKVANFTVHAGLGPGGWAFIAALLITAWVVSAPALTAGPATLEKTGGGSGDGKRAGNRAGGGLIALGVGVLVILVTMIGGLVLIPRFQAAHPATDLQRSDADRAQVDDLYLDLTLVTPAFLDSRRLGHYLGDRSPETVLPFLAGLNTHRGSIDHMHHLHGEMFLIAPDGTRYPSLSEPIVLSQHHNAYMLLFPARDQRGERFLDYAAGNLVVEAVGVGAEPVRRFEWQLPLANAAAPGLGHGLVPSLMLLVALVGALLVVLSPCALELSLYYSAIISCTVTEGERDAAVAGQGSAASIGRRRILVNLGAFVTGFTLLYAVSGATVGLIGEGVRRPLGEYAEIIPIIGGSLIIFFALKVMGVGELIGRLRRRWSGGGHGATHGSHGFLGTLLAAPGRFLAGLRTRAQARSHQPGGMRPRDSFLVGVGLSSSCVTCMGGAVLYPLLVYVGITSWYWGLLTLGLYSLGIALPMLAIALGFFKVRLSLTRRLGFNRGLRFASGALLAGIGTLILTGQERVVTDVAFGFLGGISRWLG